MELSVRSDQLMSMHRVMHDVPKEDPTAVKLAYRTRRFARLCSELSLSSTTTELKAKIINEVDEYFCEPLELIYAAENSNILNLLTKQIRQDPQLLRVLSSNALLKAFGERSTRKKLIELDAVPICFYLINDPEPKLRLNIHSMILIASQDSKDTIYICNKERLEKIMEQIKLEYTSRNDQHLFVLLKTLKQTLITPGVSEILLEINLLNLLFEMLYKLKPLQFQTVLDILAEFTYPSANRTASVQFGLYKEATALIALCQKNEELLTPLLALLSNMSKIVVAKQHFVNAQLIPQVLKALHNFESEYLWLPAIMLLSSLAEDGNAKVQLKPHTKFFESLADKAPDLKENIDFLIKVLYWTP